MVNLSKVNDYLSEYEKNDPERLEAVRKVVTSKSTNWDSMIKDENGNDVEIATLLLYEYATTMEEVTGKRESFENFLGKVGSIDKLRFGELKDGDEDIRYGKSLNDDKSFPVKSSKFDLEVRAKGYGAGHFGYIGEDGSYQKAVVIFGEKTVKDENGKKINIAGSKFNNLSDLRQTMFHEWTHEFEVEYISEQEYEQSNRYVYQEGMPNQREFENYERSVLPDGTTLIMSNGIATVEIVNGKRQMNNQITEGFVELTARTVMRKLGIPESEIETDRYYEHTEIADKIVSARDKTKGEGATIADFVTHSSKIKKELEEKDVLPEISDYATKANAQSTEKWKVLKRAPKLVQKLGIDKDKVSEIQSLNFWSTKEVSDEDIKELQSYLLTGDESLDLEVNTLIDEYIKELKAEREFFEGISKDLDYKDNVTELLGENKLLARAMDFPSVRRPIGDVGIAYDFSTWAEEYDIAKIKGLTSLSTTLLVKGEIVPTYKAIGFLVDGNKSKVRHVSEYDSGSNGNEASGNFKAGTPNLESLDKLANVIHQKQEETMNEVNINMNEDAYVGLFTNQAGSLKTLASIIMAQKYYELQTGKVLPIYTYNSQEGSLTRLDIASDEKANIIKECLSKKILRSSTIFYETESGESKNIDYFDSIRTQDKVIEDGTQAVYSMEAITRNGLGGKNPATADTVQVEEMKAREEVAKENGKVDIDE